MMSENERLAAALSLAGHDEQAARVLEKERAEQREVGQDLLDMVRRKRGQSTDVYVQGDGPRSLLDVLVKPADEVEAEDEGEGAA